MYNNIGKKIKVLAKFILVILTIFSVILSIILYDQSAEPVYFLLLITGPLGALISSWLLYGFGELIVKTTEIAENTRNNKENVTEATESK